MRFAYFNCPFRRICVIINLHIFQQGVVCLENDNAKKAMLKKRRKEYFAKYYKENKERISEHRKIKRKMDDSVAEAERKRYKDNASFREKKVKYVREYREKIKQDEQLSKAERAKRKEKYMKLKESPELREKELERARLRHRERMATDAEYREKRKQYASKYRKKLKTGDAAGQVIDNNKMK